MKPYCHSRNSVKKWGGKVEDYLPIHDFLDSTKSAHADMRHRAILHNAFGIFLVEKVFGTYIVNSDGVKVQTRDIAEDHVIEDLGKIPSVGDWVKCMPLQQWMGGPVHKTTKFIDFEDINED